MALTLEDALLYLGIDSNMDNMINHNVIRCLKTAEKTMRGAVGDDVRDYLPNDSRADELVLIYLDDLYSERGVSAKVSNAVRRSVQDMEMQLRLELQRAKEAVN